VLNSCSRPNIRNMAYDNSVLFRDFYGNFPNDIPECYNNKITYDSVVYLTGYDVKQMMDFMRRKEDTDSEMMRKYDIAFSITDVMRGVSRNVFF